MKVSVLQENLAHGLSVVARAVAPRSTLPVLGNILLATDEGRLRLSATNLELGITCWIGAKIEEEGSTTVPARTFTDLVSTLPPDQVNMDLIVRTQTMNVRCGASNTDLKCIDAQEFPPMPVPDLSEGIQIGVSDFKDIQAVKYAQVRCVQPLGNPHRLMLRVNLPAHFGPVLLGGLARRAVNIGEENNRLAVEPQKVGVRGVLLNHVAQRAGNIARATVPDVVRENHR